LYQERKKLAEKSGQDVQKQLELIEKLEKKDRPEGWFQACLDALSKTMRAHLKQDGRPWDTFSIAYIIRNNIQALLSVGMDIHKDFEVCELSSNARKVAELRNRFAHQTLSESECLELIAAIDRVAAIFSNRLGKGQATSLDQKDLRKAHNKIGSLLAGARNLVNHARRVSGESKITYLSLAVAEKELKGALDPMPRGSKPLTASIIGRNSYVFAWLYAALIDFETQLTQQTGKFNFKAGKQNIEWGDATEFWPQRCKDLLKENKRRKEFGKIRKVRHWVFHHNDTGGPQSDGDIRDVIAYMGRAIRDLAGVRLCVLSRVCAELAANPTEESVKVALESNKLVGDDGCIGGVPLAEALARPMRAGRGGATTGIEPKSFLWEVFGFTGEHRLDTADWATVNQREKAEVKWKWEGFDFKAARVPYRVSQEPMAIPLDDNKSFTGRREELEYVVSALTCSNPPGKRVLIYGGPGMGKVRPYMSFLFSSRLFSLLFN
jgi:hypothetical protein